MNHDAKPEAALSMASFAGPALSAARAGLDTTVNQKGSNKEQSDSEKESESSYNDHEMIQVVVKTVGLTENLKVSVSQDASVRDLKQQITQRLDLPGERQRLIYSGRMLNNNQDRLVDDVNMTLDGTNYVHLAPLPQTSSADEQPAARRRANRSEDPMWHSPVPDSEEDGDDDEVHFPYLYRLGHRQPDRRPRSRDVRRMQASPYGGGRASPGLAGTTLPTHRVQSLLSQRNQFEELHRSVPPAMVCHQSPTLMHHQPMASLADAIALSRRAASLEPPSHLAPIPVPICPPPSLAASHYPAHAMNDAAITAQVMNDAVRDADIINRVNALVPLADALPRHLTRVLATFPRAVPPSSNSLQEFNYQAQLEDTANVLETVAHQSLLLGQELRDVSHGRQLAAATSAYPSVSTSLLGSLQATPPTATTPQQHSFAYLYQDALRGRTDLR